MTWKLIVKNKDTQPHGNDYTQWKEQISAECFRQCVYCTISEDSWGGIDNYHIEHYRPKSKFPALELDICNLFYACPICNRFKSDDWPNDPDAALALVCYPNPSITDYNAIFSPDGTANKILPRNRAATYLIERLFLNRPQLVYERREKMLMAKESALRKEVVQLAITVGDQALLTQTLTLIDNLVSLLHERKNVRPYKQSEIRKP